MSPDNSITSLARIEYCKKIIEKPSFLINYLVELIRVKFVGGGTLLIDRPSHFLQLLQDELDALIH